MEREGFSGATEDTNEVVLPGLDSPLLQVAAVVVRWDNMEIHVCVTNFGEVGGREFVVEHLVLGTMPCSFMRARAWSRARTISTSVLFFMGLIHEEALSMSCTIIWY